MDKSSKKIVTDVKTEIAQCVRILNLEFRKKDKRNKHSIREALRKLQDMKLEERRFKEFPLIESVRLYREESGDIGDMSRALLARWPKQDPRKPKPQTNTGATYSLVQGTSNKKDDGASKDGVISASKSPLVKEREVTTEKNEDKTKGTTSDRAIESGSKSKTTDSGSGNGSSSKSSSRPSNSDNSSIGSSNSGSGSDGIGQQNGSNIIDTKPDSNINSTSLKEYHSKHSTSKDSSVKNSSSSSGNKSSNSNSNYKDNSSNRNKASSSNSKETESKLISKSSKESYSKTCDISVSKESASKDKSDTSKNITKPYNAISSANVCDWFDQNNNESASISIRKSSNSKSSEKNESSGKNITSSKSNSDHKGSAEGIKNVQVVNQPKVERATKKISRNIRELTKPEFAQDGTPKLRNLDDASATLRNESSSGAASSGMSGTEHTETKKKNLKDQAGINKSDGRKESGKIKESRKSEVDLSELFFAQTLPGNKPSFRQSGSLSATEAKEKEMKKSGTENKAKKEQEYRNVEKVKGKESRKVDHGALLDRQNLEESSRSASGLSNSQSYRETKEKEETKSGSENKETQRKSGRVSVKSFEKMEKIQSEKSNQESMSESNSSAKKKSATGGGKTDTLSKAKKEAPGKNTVDEDLYLSDDSLPDIFTSMEISETTSLEVQAAEGKGKSILGKRRAEESSDDQIESKKTKKEKKRK